MIAIIHGFILALGLILPLGAQNVFVFNQGAVQPRFVRALPVILTASICDTILILLAVLGVSVLVLANPVIKTALILVGVIFLIYMGFVTYRSKPPGELKEEQGSFSPKRQILFAASVSLLNPHAILDTIGVIGTSSLTYSGLEKTLFTASCIIVSWLWFLGLAGAGRYAGKMKNSSAFMKYINKISAFLIWGTAIYIFYTNLL